jgi:hypothetical protein
VGRGRRKRGPDKGQQFDGEHGPILAEGEVARESSVASPSSDERDQLSGPGSVLLSRLRRACWRVCSGREED